MREPTEREMAIADAFKYLESVKEFRPVVRVAQRGPLPIVPLDDCCQMQISFWDVFFSKRDGAIFCLGAQKVL